MVWPGAGASSGGTGLSVACPVQGPAQQLCTVDGLGKCWQKSAGMGPWAWGPRQVSCRRWMPFPQETEHWQEKGRGVGLTRPEDDEAGGGQRPGVICRDLCRHVSPFSRRGCPASVTQGGGAGIPAQVSVTLEASATPNPRAGIRRRGRLPLCCQSLQPSVHPALPCSELPSAPAQMLRVLLTEAGVGDLHRLFSTPRASEGTQPYLLLSSCGLVRFWARNGTC